MSEIKDNLQDFEDNSGEAPAWAEIESAGPLPWPKDHIHSWFELSYANYLTVPRSVLQSMPEEWQERFVKCLEELDETIDWRPEKGRYWVQLRDQDGKFVPDPFQDYERGRRQIPHIKQNEQ